MTGLTIQISAVSTAAIIDVLGGLARLLFVFTATQFVYKLVESKMFRTGRARISPTGRFDPYRIFVFLAGIPMTALTFFSISFIDSVRRVDGSRTVTINRLKICEDSQEDPSCKSQSVANFNTTGSTFDTTIARFQVEGGLLNAEELVNGTSVITLKDCSIRQRLDLCDSEMLEFLNDTFDKKNIILDASLSKVKRIGSIHKLYIGDIETIDGGKRGSIRSRTLCESNAEKTKINHCSIWFVREDRNEILLSYPHVIKDAIGCDQEASSCFVREIGMNINELGIATEYEGLAFLLNFGHRSDEFLDHLAEILAARNMVLNKALWDVLENWTASTETVLSEAKGGEIVEDSELRVPALVCLGAIILIALISAITLFIIE